MEQKVTSGNLYLIPAPLGDIPVSAAIPDNVLRLLPSIKIFIVEELRTARRFLKKAVPSIDIDALVFLLFNEHSEKTDLTAFIDPLLKGNDVGLLSEAGLPCLADPGSEIVKRAHEAGIRVIPLTGPSSILLSLIASGFNGQNFAFQGYLPVDRQDRKKKLKELENTAKTKRQTQIFIETPYRNLRLFEAILETCHDTTLLCIAAGLTTPDEYIKTQSIKLWKQHKPPVEKQPSVFLLYTESA
jgi:16S rRNA (cytidine1402-2'-O)-methyltransferase